MPQCRFCGVSVAGDRPLCPLCRMHQSILVNKGINALWKHLRIMEDDPGMVLRNMGVKKAGGFVSYTYVPSLPLEQRKYVVYTNDFRESLLVENTMVTFSKGVLKEAVERACSDIDAGSVDGSFALIYGAAKRYRGKRTTEDLAFRVVGVELEGWRIKALIKPLETVRGDALRKYMEKSGSFSLVLATSGDIDIGWQDTRRRVSAREYRITGFSLEREHFAQYDFGESLYDRLVLLEEAKCGC